MLLARSFPEIHVLSEGEPAPSFDVHCPLLSLPPAFGTTLASVPADVPYLRVDAALAERWQGRLRRFAGLRIGLVWAGNKSHKRDAQRSLPLAAMEGLLALPGVHWISLQKGDARAQLPPYADRIIDWTDELTDFGQTAALVSQLDLVIAVDTAVAHLAGALGRPVNLLLPSVPDWRWLLDRSTSPWYPAMRLFRQPQPGAWNEVLAGVAAAIRSSRP